MAADEREGETEKNIKIFLWAYFYERQDSH